MGTTAEKLKYLNETKAEIKNALETPYNVMRDYPELIKKYIDNQPTKVVTDGICGNAVDVPVKVIEINGNIRQETTEGYQLLDTSSYSTETKNGVTATRQRDGSIKVTGTATADVQFDIVVFTPNSKDKAYFLSGCPAGGSISTYCLNLNVYGVNDVGEGVSFTNKVNPTYVRIKVASGVTIDKVFYLMITEGVEKKTYEPYTGGIPSPNPDYPSEIETVGNNGNLYDKDNPNVLDTPIDSNGLGGNIKNTYKTVWIPCKPNTTYTVSKKYDATKNRFALAYTSEEPNYSQQVEGYVSNAYTNVMTITTNSTAKYLLAYVWIVGGSTTYQEMLNSIKINESAIKIKHSGKNLFDKDSQDMFLKGLTPDNIGKIVASPTNTSTSNYLVTIIIPCLPDSTYIISRYAEGKTYLVYESSKKDLKVGDNVTFLKKNDNTGIINEKITTGTNAKYLLVKIYNTYATEPNTYNDLISSVQIEKGSTATPYEPYHEPIITPINLQGNILSKMRDVKDILRVNRNGKVEIKKNIGKVVLTGEEVLIDNSSTSIRKWWGINFSNYGIYQYNDPTKVCDVLTTKFKPRPQQGTFLPKQVALTTKNKNMYFVFEPDTTEEQARAILTDMPVYFRLATPQTITLPSISPIELWEGTNRFKLITNLDTDFEVEYVVDKDSVTKEEE